MADKQLLLLIASVFLLGLAVVAGLEAARQSAGPEAGGDVTESVEPAT